MVMTGGLRDRAIHESILRDIEAHMTSLGWFDSGRRHGPIAIVDEYPDENAEVPINTISVSVGDVRSTQMELGSLAESISIPIFIDMFAESDGLGRHVIGDIASYVHTQGQFDVYDYNKASPTLEFVVQLVDGTIERRKPTRAVNSWQKHWYILVFMVTEERSNA
jgi:hypothetical protein